MSLVEHDAGKSGPETATPEVARFRILVVDDEALIGQVTVSMLEDLGHSAHWVPSGDEALATLNSDPDFDLVITDHAMPGISGGALAEALRDSHPTLPVILATGFSDVPESYAHQLPKLAKPYGPDDLAALLAQVGRQRG